MPTPGAGPEPTLPRLKTFIFAVVLACALGSALGAERNTIRATESATPPEGVVVQPDGKWLMPCVATPRTMRCPRGVICLYRRVQDGPDGFPTSVIRPDCDVSTEEMQELVTEVTPPDDVIFDPTGKCAESLTDCETFKNRECQARWPLPAGATAATLNKVTKYEEGKSCNVTCKDKNGVEHKLECELVPIRTKPAPKPIDQALPPG